MKLVLSHETLFKVREFKREYSLLTHSCLYSSLRTSSLVHGEEEVRSHLTGNSPDCRAQCSRERASRSLRPYVGRRRNRNARNAVGIASYESIMSRAKAEERGKKENGSPILHFESADLASRAGADVEGSSGFS